MDFFKSVFADEPSESSDSDEPQRQAQNDVAPGPESPPRSNSSTSWSFGGLIKTLATKSESVIQTYRKDLEEFGSGLRMESAVIRDAASRAVKDLPASLEVGATVAQESLESVGQAIDGIGSSVWKSTAEIISQGRDSLLATSAVDDDTDASENNSRRLSLRRSFDSKTNSRFEVQLRPIQSNASTYLDDPGDLGDYKLWKSGFDLDKKKEEIENLIKENGEEIGEIYDTLVPISVDHESFWFRYFYKVHKSKEFEDARAKLVKRAISGEAEDLSWDFDDDEQEDEDGNKSKKAQEKLEPESESVRISDNGGKEKPAEAAKASENSDSCKDSDVSIVSRPEEADLGWDEIEDIGSSDENKAVIGSGESSNRADLRNSLSNASEEDEDLSWDIEDEEDDDDDDDDEQPKKS